MRNSTFDYKFKYNHHVYFRGCLSKHMYIQWQEIDFARMYNAHGVIPNRASLEAI